MMHHHMADPAPGDSFFGNLLKTYVPRVECMYHERNLILLHVVSDTMIAAAYYSIPVGLIYFARRRKDLAFNYMFLLFALFIVLCGTTHIFNVISIWHSYYRLDGLVKLATGIASMASTVAMWYLMPTALALPSLREIHTRKNELEKLVDLRTAELTAAHDALLESEHKFRAVADSIPQLAWMTDATGAIIWFNRKWYDFTGKSAGEMLGWGWETVHDPAHLARVTAKFRDAIASGEPWEDTFPLRRRDGEFRWQLSRALPVRDEQGRITHWFGTNTDITEQLEIEGELRRAKQSAEAANKAKTEFLANMSHEIRTPMNAIVGLTDLLRRDDVPEDKRRLMLDTMASSADQLMELIDNLLDIARIESRTVKLSKESFTVDAVVSEIMQINSVLAARKNISLQQDRRGATDAEVLGDPLRLKQVLMNIVSNAVKFTEEGYVRLEAACTARRGFADIEFRVADTGIGIPPDKLDSVFGMFTQADATITRKYGGTGLGLSIAKMLVDMMGGRIAVASSPGAGTIFTITLTLPLAGQHMPAPSPASAPPLPHLHVLVVEDYEPNIVVATSILESLGCTFVVARDGRQALDMLSSARFDLVLMDVQMPVLDGCAATKLLREREGKGRRTPVVALTAHAATGDREKCLQAGMDDYLVKPFTADHLRQVIALHLRKKEEPVS